MNNNGLSKKSFGSNPKVKQTKSLKKNKESVLKKSEKKNDKKNLSESQKNELMTDKKINKQLKSKKTRESDIELINEKDKKESSEENEYDEVEEQKMKEIPNSEEEEVEENIQHKETDSMTLYPEDDEYYEKKNENEKKEEINEVEEEINQEEINEEEEEKVECESDFFENSDIQIDTDSSDLSDSDNGEKGVDKIKNKKKKKKDRETKENTSIYENVLSKLNVEKKEELEKSHIIILGAKDVGKSCLVQALQKMSLIGENDDDYIYQNINSALPLDYACLNVINFEESTKVKNVLGNAHIWIVQHSSYISSLVKHMKKCKNIKKIIVLMCTDLYKPYNIMSDLNHWIESLYTLFEEFQSDNDITVYNELKEKLEDYVYNYKKKKMLEKKMLENKKKGNKVNSVVTNDNITNEENAIELDKKNLIKINLAFPILFVICKSDGHEILNNRTYQGYIDVIISYLRNLAIHYQASIIFCNTTNVKEPKNISLLYKYIMHRLYDFPFSENEILNDYEKIFIPSGYDTVELINESIKNTFVGNFNKPYDSIIFKPMTNKNIVEHSHNVVNDVHFNDFLASIKQDLSNDDEEGINKNIDSNNRSNDDNNKGNDNDFGDIIGNAGTAGGKKIFKSTSENDNGHLETLKIKKRPIISSLSKDNVTDGNVSVTSLNNNMVTSFCDKKENIKKNSFNVENNDQSLHSFFQNLLAKGRTKPQNVQNVSSTLAEKKS